MEAAISICQCDQMQICEGGCETICMAHNVRRHAVRSVYV